MRKSTLCLGVILLGLAAVPGPLPGAAPLYAPASPPFIELAAEGVARAVVVVPDDAPREMRRAAEELATYVRRISGAELKIAAEPGDGAAVVLEVDPGLHPRPAGKRDWPGAGLSAAHRGPEAARDRCRSAGGAAWRVRPGGASPGRTLAVAGRAGRDRAPAEDAPRGNARRDARSPTSPSAGSAAATGPSATEPTPWSRSASSRWA